MSLPSRTSSKLCLFLVLAALLLLLAATGSAFASATSIGGVSAYGVSGSSDTTLTSNAPATFSWSVGTAVSTGHFTVSVVNTKNLPHTWYTVGNAAAVSGKNSYSWIHTVPATMPRGGYIGDPSHTYLIYVQYYLSGGAKTADSTGCSAAGIAVGDGMEKGVDLPLWGAGTPPLYNGGALYDDLLSAKQDPAGPTVFNTIAADTAHWVAINPVGCQEAYDTDSISFDPSNTWTVPDSLTTNSSNPWFDNNPELDDAITLAQQQGLDVMLKPYIEVKPPTGYEGVAPGVENYNASLNGGAWIGYNWVPTDHYFGQTDTATGIPYYLEYWAAWWKSYDAFILHYAQLAQNTGCQQLEIGGELDCTQGDQQEIIDPNSTLTTPLDRPYNENNLVSQFGSGFNPATSTFPAGSWEQQLATSNAQQWLTLTADVRQIYSGQLVYGATFNKDGDAATGIPWWGALDYIGVHVYRNTTSSTPSTPSNPTPDPSVADFELTWRHDMTNILVPLSQKFNKPIVISETGMESYYGAGLHSNDNGAASSYTQDLTVQQNYYRATLDYLATDPTAQLYVDGVFWWNWYTTSEFASNYSHNNSLPWDWNLYYMAPPPPPTKSQTPVLTAKPAELTLSGQDPRGWSGFPVIPDGIEWAAPFGQ
jgi:hypothetical protein